MPETPRRRRRRRQTLIDTETTALSAEGAGLSSDERQLMRVWLALIDGTVPTPQIDEAWAAARMVQAIYTRMLDDAYARGHAAGVTDAGQEAKQAGYSEGWNEATLDVLQKLPMPARHEGDEFGLPPDTPSTVS